MTVPAQLADQASLGIPYFWSAGVWRRVVDNLSRLDRRPFVPAGWSASAHSQCPDTRTTYLLTQMLKAKSTEVTTIVATPIFFR